MTDRIDACATCRFFQSSKTGLGQCRRSAPSTNTADSHLQPDRSVLYRAAWPSVDASEWCGEYEARNG